MSGLYRAYLAIPPTLREPIRSAVLSYILALGPAFGALMVAGLASGSLNDPHSTVAYLGHNYWVTLLGAAFNPASLLRGRQALDRLSNTVVLPTGEHAVLTSSDLTGAAPPQKATP